jgi:hypothetical protein
LTGNRNDGTGRNEILPFGGTNKGYDLGKDLGMAIVEEEEEEVSSNSWTFFGGRGQVVVWWSGWRRNKRKSTSGLVLALQVLAVAVQVGRGEGREALCEKPQRGIQLGLEIGSV